MELTWEESKRTKTLKERGLDFVSAHRFFDGRAILHQFSPRGGEERLKSTALLDDGKFFTIVWTWRDNVVRIISMRRSHEKEERKYRQLFSH